MTAALSYVSRHRSLSLTWGRDRHAAGPAARVDESAAPAPEVAHPAPQPPPAAPRVSMPTATVTAVPRPDGRLTPTEKAAKAGRASAATATPEERKDRASKGGQAIHTPLALTDRLIRRWALLSEQERAEQLPEIRRRLRQAGIIR